MKKLALTLTASFALGISALAVSAQTQQPGAASLHAQLNNATPLVTKAACGGWGPYCGPGWVRRCGYWGCRCVRCW